MGFTVKKRVLRRVLRRGSENGVSRRCAEHPLGEYDPLGMRPSHNHGKQISAGSKPTRICTAWLDRGPV